MSKFATVVQIVFIVCLGTIILGCGQRNSVSPQVRDVYLSSGGKDDFILKVNLSEVPPSREPLDVLFLFDATGSMGNVINKVKDRAADIMQIVEKLSTNCAFGVASFTDYIPQRLPWRLHQDIIRDTRAVTEALKGVDLVGGGDLPEAYSRALYESRFLHWRQDVRRFIILFGDAPAHDPEFYGKDYGIDPGRDNIPGTPDDLSFRDVVQQIAADKITIIVIYDTTRGQGKEYIDDAIKGFEFMAQQTGGITKPIKSARDVTDAIKAGLSEKFRPKPVVIVPSEFNSWLTASVPRKDPQAGHRFNFDITLHPPEGTSGGIYRIPLRVAFDTKFGGGDIGQTMVIIRIGLWNYPWRNVLIPLYLLLLLILLLRVVGRRRTAVRYDFNNQFLAVCWRLLIIIALLSGLYIIWLYAPGTLPPHLGGL